jgi:hypothetical protein
MKTLKVLSYASPNVALAGDEKSPARVSVPINSAKPAVGASILAAEVAGKRLVFKGLAEAKK